MMKKHILSLIFFSLYYKFLFIIKVNKHGSIVINFEFNFFQDYSTLIFIFKPGLT